MNKSRWLQPITDRITQPTPDEVRLARVRAGLGQADAAQLISPASKAPRRVWQNFEVTSGRAGLRAISLPAWELFLLLTDQHPSLQLTVRHTVGE